MDIRTADGIRIDCLPDGARCTCTGVSPIEMFECPVCQFDYYGLECAPELCELYEEVKVE